MGSAAAPVVESRVGSKLLEDFAPIDLVPNREVEEAAILPTNWRRPATVTST